MESQVEPPITELIARIDSALALDNDELVALREELAALRSIQAERDHAQREAEWTLSQLHEAQKELQHYVLLCQRQAQILSAAEAVQARSFALLAKGNN